MVKIWKPEQTMFSTAEREAIVALIKREVIPAIGCTEPVAVSLCVARATELLGAKPVPRL